MIYLSRKFDSCKVDLSNRNIPTISSSANIDMCFWMEIFIPVFHLKETLDASSNKNRIES